MNPILVGLLVGVGTTVVLYLLRRPQETPGSGEDTYVYVRVAEEGDHMSIPTPVARARKKRNETVTWHVQNTAAGDKWVRVGRFLLDGEERLPLTGALHVRAPGRGGVGRIVARVRHDAPLGTYKYSVFVEDAEVLDPDLDIYG